MVKKIGIAVLLIAMAGTAAAGVKDGKCGKACMGKAPEIDPASAVAALTLLAGGLLVINGRRAKSTNT